MKHRAKNRLDQIRTLEAELAYASPARAAVIASRLAKLKGRG